MRKIWGISAVAVVAAFALAVVAYLQVTSNGPSIAGTRSGAATNGVKKAAPSPSTLAPAGQTAQAAQPKGPKPGRAIKGVRVWPTDRILGKADAPVTVIEYASLTCPHCAQFHKDVLPQFKKDYVDSGKAKLIFRDFPLDRLAFAAAVVARCNEGERYFGLLDALFRSQDTWSRSPDPIKSLRSIARLGGIQPDRFDTCLNDKAMQDNVASQRFDASRRLRVNSTPTLIINGTLYSGGLTLDEMKAVIDPLLPKS